MDLDLVATYRSVEKEMRVRKESNAARAPRSVSERRSSPSFASSIYSAGHLDHRLEYHSSHADRGPNRWSACLQRVIDYHTLKIPQAKRRTENFGTGR